MEDEPGRLELAKWILERNIYWVGAAEIKTAVIVAADTAMLATLATAFGAVEPSDRTGWPMLFSVVSAICLIAALFCGGMSVLPRTEGPASSLIFFGRIVKLGRPDYAEAFRRADLSALMQDFLDQTHRNAEIACAKYQWVTKAMWWSFLSIIPWILALGVLMSAAKP
jgi:hypothetical protein